MLYMIIQRRREQTRRDWEEGRKGEWDGNSRKATERAKKRKARARPYYQNQTLFNNISLGKRCVMISKMIHDSTVSATNGSALSGWHQHTMTTQLMQQLQEQREGSDQTRKQRNTLSESVCMLCLCAVFSGLCICWFLFLWWFQIKSSFNRMVFWIEEWKNVF